MAPISVTGQKSWRLGTGIALIILGFAVLAIGVMNARLDIYGGFIAAMNMLTGGGMILFHRL